MCRRSDLLEVVYRAFISEFSNRLTSWNVSTFWFPPTCLTSVHLSIVRPGKTCLRCVWHSDMLVYRLPMSHFVDRLIILSLSTFWLTITCLPRVYRRLTTFSLSTFWPTVTCLPSVYLLLTTLSLSLIYPNWTTVHVITVTITTNRFRWNINVQLCRRSGHSPWCQASRI